MGFFAHLFVLEHCSVSPGVKNKEVDYLSLKYDLILKFPCQWPETKCIESCFVKLGLFLLLKKWNIWSLCIKIEI